MKITKTKQLEEDDDIMKCVVTVTKYGECHLSKAQCEKALSDLSTLPDSRKTRQLYDFFNSILEQINSGNYIVVETSYCE